MVAMTYECRIKAVTPQRLVSIRRMVPRDEFASALERAFDELWAWLNRQESVTVGPAMAWHRGVGDALAEIEAAFPIAEALETQAPLQVRELPGGRAAVTMHHGPYDALPHAYAALESWLHGEGHAAIAPPYEVYWVDPSQTENPNELRTEVVWPVR